MIEGSAHKTSRRWRIARAEIAKSVLIPGDQWHPLDGGAAPEYIPEIWDGPHVGLRLVEAFKTLSHLPSGLNSGGASGYWPEYFYEWEDLLAQKTADKATQEDDAKVHNRAHIRPSAQEISRMEMAICWPGRYVFLPATARVVQCVALYRSRDMDLEYVARKMRRAPQQLRAINRAGLDMIATGLQRADVRVF